MDYLEKSRRLALDTLIALPTGTQLFVSESEPSIDTGSLMLGLGLCIGKGHAVYLGDGHYRVTLNGRAYAVEQD